jgi:predicted transposase YbfD/YdcC
MAAEHVAAEPIGSSSECMTDPRDTRDRRHRFRDLVVLAVGGVVCGCDGPAAIRRWAAARAEWLGGFSELPDGIPSRDWTRNPLLAGQPEAFQRCFPPWIAHALVAEGGTPSRLVAIDGTTVRRSHDAARGLGPLPLVSAGATEHGAAVGQVAAEEKSDAITAIPVLLRRLELKRAVVTTDAMGCQKDSARDIVAGGGEFVIAVEDDRPELAAGIASVVEKDLEGEVRGLRHRNHQTDTHGHGRRDERCYWVARVPPGFAAKGEWPWVNAVGTGVRITTHPDGTQTDEGRYYILSRFISGPRFGQAVRGHRGIEAMHGVLDVTFGEDQARTRQRILADNLSWVRRFAITLLKRHPEKDSIRGKMIRCLMGTSFLSEVLTLQGN